MFEEITRKEIEAANRCPALIRRIYLNRIDAVYKNGTIPAGSKKLDGFTRREIVVARLLGDTDHLRVIEAKHSRLELNELDEHYHEIDAE